MNPIVCISEEKNIYKKGDVTFEVAATPEIISAYVINADDSNYLYIGNREYEDVWVPRLKAHFPKLSTDMYSWDKDTYGKGYVIIYESSEISNLNRFLNVLSDIPDEFDDSPLSVRDMSAKVFMVALERFRMEIPSNSILMKKFDDSQLSVRDMSAKDFMVALDRFRMEIPSNSILMKKFDELFPQ